MSAILKDLFDTSEDFGHRRTLLISIHENYAELILSGQKNVELRRRFDPNTAGCRMLIYATLPTAAIIGSIQIEAVNRLPIAEIWARHGSRASIPEPDFYRYFSGTDWGCAIMLEQPKRFATPISLEVMREKYGLNAPQSYIILRDSHSDLIRHEQS
jgi:predicted transcriptional regulator